MKKAQLKIQEMAFMLMALIILFVIAGLFFISIKYREMYKTADSLEKEKTISLISKFAELPEFTCGEGLCIDSDRLIVIRNRKAYENFFPLSSIKITKLGGKEMIECDTKNYPDCNLFIVFDKKAGNEEILSTFVSLCRKELTETGFLYEKCELGKILAGFEVK